MTHPILGGIALAGALMAAILLPSRPKTPANADVSSPAPSEPVLEPALATQTGTE